jgi:glutathione-regulated potassium-efflux system ancillary protein KefF
MTTFRPAPAPVMPHTLVIHAHPSHRRSVVTQALKATFEEPGADVEIRSLYELYPDFDIDVAAEQAALLRAELIVWLAPIHWYSVPALMKHWIDQVLLHGWAYGHGSQALRGKTTWWVTSAGAGTEDYTATGAHGRPFAEFVPPVEHTARFCGMQWLPPFVVHQGHAASPEDRHATCQRLKAQWQQHLDQARLTAAPSRA